MTLTEINFERLRTFAENPAKFQSLFEKKMLWMKVENVENIQIQEDVIRCTYQAGKSEYAIAFHKNADGTSSIDRKMNWSVTYVAVGFVALKIYLRSGLLPAIGGFIVVSLLIYFLGKLFSSWSDRKLAKRIIERMDAA